MKRHRFYACLLTVMTLAGFTACSSTDNDGVTDGQTVNGKSQLTLTINTMGTRAAMTSDPTDEKTINRVTVGIFDASGNVRTIQEFKSDDGTVGSNTFKTDNGSTKMNIVTNKLEEGDQVLVAVNAPSGLFHGAQTVSGFQSKSVDAGRALATNASDEKTVQTDQVANNAPMFGSAKLEKPASGATAYTASVNVSHLTAKISLTDIEVAFDPNGSYQNATFSPTEIYIEHVVDSLNFNPEAGHWFTPADLSKTPLLTGATGVAGAKSYLTTGTISGVTLSGAKDATTAKMPNDHHYYFYVTPSSNITPSGTNANAVRVWIKGEFDPDGPKGNTGATTVFYPVLLNVKYDAAGAPSAVETGTDEYKVYPNRNYTCSIVIKTKGLPGIGEGGKTQPDGTNGNDELKPQQATITVSVENWTPVTQTTTFE
ncbi:fimbrial protein [Hallella absiana]|uniref:fimbrial protein n=1 Tax=Hallella absiana TaxID=2925336 RepID=UPI0021C8C37C|nr:fimbrial protein [Hallella absiana]